MAAKQNRSMCPRGVTRRGFLVGGLAAGAFLVVRPAAAHVAVAEKRLILAHPHTGESFRGVYWANGDYLPEALARLHHLLRDYKNDKRTAIDLRLFDMLHDLQARLGAVKPIQVISGYRSAETNAAARRKQHGVARNSFHIQGRAVDIRVPGQSLAGARRAAVATKAGGVGFYPAANYLHLDTGPARIW
ncbi:MAG: DUF882 domain-containing protein [Rhodospirillales bacterium]|nr:DUF882 domain-containing protein [Rhodospirillales bacterium]